MRRSSVDSPRTGVWRITPRGRERLARHPKGFDDATAKQIVREYHEGKGSPPPPEGPDDPRGPAAPQAPEERIDDAVSEIEQAVADDLLERILEAPPAFFEQLVLELLQKLGYGTGAEDTKRLGRVGDGGIDGVINLDRLGLEKVYIQAKRWQGSVGRPEVQAFFGALAGRRARKGVFITTSTFTREAREYGEQVSESVVLIDGAGLARLMIESGVAVTHHRVIRLPRIDQDYFDTVSQQRLSEHSPKIRPIRVLGLTGKSCLHSDAPPEIYLIARRRLCPSARGDRSRLVCRIVVHPPAPGPRPWRPG